MSTNSMLPASSGYMMTPEEAQTIEDVVVKGDLAKLTPDQRAQYYWMRCEAAGLDPRSQPFQYITLQNKLTLYATKAATDQLCEKRNISTEITSRERDGEAYVVVCRASMKSGRFTDATGAVTIGTLKGDAYCNAIMKAETKAKRRAVLALCGLGMLDETETETIPGAVVHTPGMAPEVQQKASQKVVEEPPIDLPQYDLNWQTDSLRMALEEIKADYPYHPQKHAILTELRRRFEAEKSAPQPAESAQIVEAEVVV